jgi:hypothetical protein
LPARRSFSEDGSFSGLSRQGLFFSAAPNPAGWERWELIGYYLEGKQIIYFGKLHFLNIAIAYQKSKKLQLSSVYPKYL